MKMLLDSEIESLSMTEFQKGFEACRSAAVKICRENLVIPQIGGPNLARPKAGHECANEIARIPVPRWKPKEEKKP